LQTKLEATTKDKKKAKIAAEIKPLKASIDNLAQENKAIEDKLTGAAKVAEEKAYIAKCSAMSTEEFNAFFLSEIKKNFPNAKQTASGLVYVIDNIGEGAKPVKGSKMSVHCTGNFRKDGSKFFSTKDAPGKPMDFEYKVQGMVPGWEEGLAMLGKGGKAKFFLPFHLAYGPQGRRGAIPPFSDLIFATEVLNITAPETPKPVDESIPPPPKPVDQSGHNHDGHNHDH
ncbi:MAG: FKBP-type peptidyl-prolyl cis-trans isomerase, partial [Crocinitomicaceae bacterium]